MLVEIAGTTFRNSRRNLGGKSGKIPKWNFGKIFRKNPETIIFRRTSGRTLGDVAAMFDDGRTDALRREGLLVHC